ncbi:MAG: SLC13 family permease [Myxococcales bacterium]|nr:SLC13 family permease [Myxococcales bacterium]
MSNGPAAPVPPSSAVRAFFFLSGPVAGLLAAGMAHRAGLSSAAVVTAGVTALCAAWWIFEPLPLAATSLLPFVVFPAAGVLSHEQVAAAYGHTLVLLFLGGFLLSAGMERSGAHERVAMLMVRAVGGGGRRLVLGFMVAAAATSMWISNTATTLMLLPMAAAAAARVGDPGVSRALMLGIAYASSIGGLGTPIGSPPNIVFMAIYNAQSGATFSFVDWMRVGVPVVLVFTPLAWWWLTRHVGPVPVVPPPRPGAWSVGQKRVLGVFVAAAVLWITRTSPAGGWNGWLEVLFAYQGKGELVGDSTVALAGAFVLFLIPDGQGARLLDWPTAERIPWGILLLFGGGIAIAQAFSASGLSAALGGALDGLTRLPPLVMIAGVCLVVTFLTEVTSNTATANVIMPILMAAALAADVKAPLLMVPAALSCSCAFMLPVATPPNAVVFGAGYVTVKDMARAGLVLNLMGVVLISLLSWLLL